MNHSNHRLERLPQVLARTGLMRSQLYNLQVARKVPAAVALGDRSVAWVAAEIDQWIDSRIAKRAEKLR
jgi:prophage regulatory protein